MRIGGGSYAARRSRHKCITCKCPLLTSTEKRETREFKMVGAGSACDYVAAEPNDPMDVAIS